MLNNNSDKLNIPVNDMNNEIVESILKLINTQQSLFLSTLDRQGNPSASYAPYLCIEKESAFYIFISDLSEHTQQLLDNPIASVLIAADEQNTQQIFARHRLTYRVKADCLGQAALKRQAVLLLMQQRFGSIMDVLSGLSDFKLFKLTAQQGRYVKGFGNAFIIEQGLTSHIQTAMRQE